MSRDSVWKASAKINKTQYATSYGGSISISGGNYAETTNKWCSHRSLPHNNGFRASLVQMLLRVSLRFRTFYLCNIIDSVQIIMLPPYNSYLCFFIYGTCLPQAFFIIDLGLTNNRNEIVQGIRLLNSMKKLCYYLNIVFPVFVCCG